MGISDRSLLKISRSLSGQEVSSDEWWDKKEAIDSSLGYDKFTDIFDSFEASVNERMKEVVLQEFIANLDYSWDNEVNTIKSNLEGIGYSSGELVQSVMDDAKEYLVNSTEGVVSKSSKAADAIDILSRNYDNALSDAFIDIAESLIGKEPV